MWFFCVAEKFLTMTLQEKRNHYRCSKHATLGEVKNWQQLAEEEMLKTEKGKLSLPIVSLPIFFSFTT